MADSYLHTEITKIMNNQTKASSWTLFLLGLGIPGVLTFLAVLAHMDQSMLLMLLGGAFLALSLFSFDLMMFGFIGLFYVKLYIFNLSSPSVYFVIPLCVSYILIYYKNTLKDLANPILLPALLYLFCTIPSIVNVTNVGLFITLMQNLVYMILAFSIIGSAVLDYRHIEKYLMYFVLWGLLNSINLIYVALQTGRRYYGFSGVVFVDFACILMLLFIPYIIFNRKGLRWVASLLFIVFFAALMFTQTRNTLISLFLTIVIILIYLVNNSYRFKLSRKKLVTGTVLLASVTVILFLTVIFIAPQVFERLTELSSNKQVEVTSGDDFGVNSLVSRFMIWHTCISAFIQHPIIGIGAFSFPTESVRYYKIPTVIFKLFVEGTGPHITYLAVLTETGIIGLMGFVYFLVATFRMNLASLRIAITDEQKFFSLLLFILQIYITISMTMTDAWLWGQCGMLWGLILGLSVANNKILLKNTMDNDAD